MPHRRRLDREFFLFALKKCIWWRDVRRIVIEVMLQLLRGGLLGSPNQHQQQPEQPRLLQSQLQLLRMLVLTSRFSEDWERIAAAWTQ